MDNPSEPPEIPPEASPDTPSEEQTEIQDGTSSDDIDATDSPLPESPDGEAGGELLPQDGTETVDDDGPSLGFDDLPDPPGGESLKSAFAPTSDEDGASSMEAVYDVPVKVQAVLGRAKMPIAELVSMRSGYVFELDRRVGEPIDVLVNDRLIARGEIVMIDGSLGVTLTEIVKQDS